MEGRAARGETDVRRAGWAVSTAECPSTGNPAFLWVTQKLTTFPARLARGSGYAE